MKLIYAGINGQQSANWGNYLFNCTRNRKCQRAYFVPIKSLSDIQLYVDLPGKPLTYEATIMDLCNPDCNPLLGDFNSDYNDDYFIGTGCIPQENHVVFPNYVVGQKPDNTWYGVFGGLNPVSYKSFFIRMTFSVNGVSYVYFSEMFTLEDCAPLVHLRGCYPNEVPPADASDCNGIYYGLPASDDTLGMANYRYFHWAYVRYGQVIASTKKVAFSFFNSLKTYKSIVTRGWVFEFEMVPPFYSDVLLGIFIRGNIQIDGAEYKLAEEQNWAVYDMDSKLWDMNTNLDQLCRQYFGCKPSDCALPALPPDHGSGSHPFPPGSGGSSSIATCKTLLAVNQDPESVLTINYLDCDGLPQTLNIQPNSASDEFCAIADSVIASGTTQYTIQINSDGCNIGTICEEYYNDSGNPIDGVSYTDCAGNYHDSITVDPGGSICITTGTMSGGGFLRFIGQCGGTPACILYTMHINTGGAMLWWQDCATGQVFSSNMPENTLQTVCSRSIPYTTAGSITLSGTTQPCHP